jgi:hydrogenase maturation protease
VSNDHKTTEGLAAARRIAGRAGGEVDVREACVATIDLLPVIAGYDRVVILDAYEDPSVPAGTPVRADPRRLPRGFGARSAHTLPLGEMLEMGRDLGCPLPREVVVHGLCVAETMTFGTTFTPLVEAAWRAWADRVMKEEQLAGESAG